MISLLHRGTEIACVQWSPDNRIAVATPECVYVLVSCIRFSKIVSAAAINPSLCALTLPATTVEDGRTSAAAQPIRCRISLASAPKPAVHPDVGVPPCTPEYYVTSKDQRVRRFFDPLFVPPSGAFDPLKAAAWSPVGCTWLGGCVLTCMTSSGRVLMFTPPGSMETHWKQVADLTETMCSLLTGCHYQIMQLNGIEAFTGLMDLTCASAGTSQPSKVAVKKSDEAFYSHRQMVAFTCCQWLPLLANGGAVVATATRSGHLVVWNVAVPVVPGGRLSVISVVDVADGKDMWVCSMCWCLCNHEVRLFVGCSNGSVHLARWDNADDVLAGKVSDQGLVEVWAPDEIGVHQIAWQPVNHTLAISKGSMLVFLSVPPTISSSDLPVYSYCPGLHNFPISGLCALLFGGFLSCSLDGSVRKCGVAPDGRYISSDVEVEPLRYGHAQSAYGVTTSSRSVFAAVVLRPNLEFSLKGMKFQSHVRFVKLADDNHVTKCMEESGYHWDVGEYIRQHYVAHESLPLFVSANCNLRNEMRLRRHLELTTGLDATAVTRIIQYRHILTSLRQWVGWRSKGGEPEGERGTVSLRHMVQRVQTNVSASEEELSLSHKVSEELHQSECEETCPICGCTVNNTADALCTKGHPFQRCSVTLCLCGELDTRWCVHCSAPSLRIDTAQKDPWLRRLLDMNPCCIYCGGLFEQLFS